MSATTAAVVRAVQLDKVENFEWVEQVVLESQQEIE